MRIKWLIAIGGTVEDRLDGVKPGDIMDVPDANGARYVAAGHAVEVAVTKAPPPEEHAVADEPEAEKAVVAPNVVPKRPVKRPAPR